LQSIFLLILQDTIQLKINLILQFILLALFAYWSKRKSGTYLSAPFIFIAALWLWHSPFLTGHYLGMGELFEYTGDIFTYGYTLVPKAAGMVGLCLCCAVWGCVFGFMRKRRIKNFQGKDWSRDDVNLSVSARNPLSFLGRISSRLAWIAFIGFVVVSFAYFTYEGVSTFSDSYFALYTDYSGSLLYRFYQSTKFFGVIAILAVFSAIKTRKSFLWAVLITGVLIFINVLMGSRSMPFIYTMALLVSLDCYVHRISFVILMVLAFLASAASFIIDQTRTIGLGLQILDFRQINRSVDFFHIFWNCGGIIRNVLRTMEFSLQSGLLYGRSIADAIIYLLPRALVDGLGFSTGFVPPSVWLIEMSNDVPPGGGLGYSLVAEAYLNFGILGCILFAFFGWFIAKNFFAYIRDGNRFSALHAYNVAIILSLHMRNDLGTYLRFLVYGYIFIELMRISQGMVPVPGRSHIIKSSNNKREKE
jgi:hypothetical protein